MNERDEHLEGIMDGKMSTVLNRNRAYDKEEEIRIIKEQIEAMTKKLSRLEGEKSPSKIEQTP